MKLVVNVLSMAIERKSVQPAPSQRSTTREVAELSGSVHVSRFLPPTVVTLRLLGATRGVVGSDTSMSGGSVVSGARVVSDTSAGRSTNSAKPHNDARLVDPVDQLTDEESVGRLSAAIRYKPQLTFV